MPTPTESRATPESSPTANEPFVFWARIFFRAMNVAAGLLGIGLGVLGIHAGSNASMVIGVLMGMIGGTAFFGIMHGVRFILLGDEGLGVWPPLDAPRKPVSPLGYVGAGLQIALWLTVLHEGFVIANLVALLLTCNAAAKYEQATEFDAQQPAWRAALTQNASNAMTVSNAPLGWIIGSDVAAINQANAEFLDYLEGQAAAQSTVKSPAAQTLDAIWREPNGTPKIPTLLIVKQFGQELRLSAEEEIPRCQASGWILGWLPRKALVFGPPRNPALAIVPNARPMPDAPNVITSSRVLPFAPEVVYRSFTDPASLAQWWGPEGWANTFHEFDLRPGGRWRFTMRGPEGKELAMNREFVEIVPNGRIVMNHLQAGHNFEHAITFTPEGAGTRLTWRLTFETAEQLTPIRQILVQANEQNFDRLAKFLAEKK